MRLLVVAVVFVLGCTHTQVGTVRKRAAFDLACPYQQVVVQEIGRETYGARGCGKRATYLTRGDCQEGGTCQAIQNGGVSEDQSPVGSASSDSDSP
ncbi:MAG: hypothetical protein HOV81_41225 [Kofleriaceae bacterium]|nr:hypothetical protein [Kofleriaceae bacterium]